MTHCFLAQSYIDRHNVLAIAPICFNSELFLALWVDQKAFELNNAFVVYRHRSSAICRGPVICIKYVEVRA